MLCLVRLCLRPKILVTDGVRGALEKIIIFIIIAVRGVEVNTELVLAYVFLTRECKVLHLSTLCCGGCGNIKTTTILYMRFVASFWVANDNVRVLAW